MESNSKSSSPLRSSLAIAYSVSDNLQKTQSGVRVHLIGKVLLISFPSSSNPITGTK